MISKDDFRFQVNLEVLLIQLHGKKEGDSNQLFPLLLELG